MRGWTLTVLLLLLCLYIPACKSSEDNTGNSLPTPSISSMTPASANPGEIDIEGRIFGNNLSGLMSVNLGSGVTVKQFHPITPTEVYIFFSVSHDAPPGPRSVVLATTGGAASASVFTVGDNRLPEAKFIVTPSYQGVRDTVFRFDGSRSEDDGRITGYKWKFGDGRTATGKVVTHKYNRPGTFEVNLTVTDDKDGSHSLSRLLDVAASKPPVASFSVSPQSGDLSTVFRFDASSSRDPDGRIQQFFWFFGDGTSGSGETIQHRFARAGSMAVTLTVKDNTGINDFVTRVTRVEDRGTPGNPPPTGGQFCSGFLPKGPDLYGTILNADRGSKTVTMQLYSSTSCSNAWYRCGDIKQFVPGGEVWYGEICSMSYLGNNTFTIRLAGSNHFPEVGENDLYLHWQECSSASRCN